MIVIPTDTECVTCNGNGQVWRYPGAPPGTPGQGIQICPGCHGRGRIQPPYTATPAVGRPKQVDSGTLFAVAHQFYWDFHRLAEGPTRWWIDEKKFVQLTEGLEDIPLVDNEDRTRHQRIVDEEIRAGRLEASQREERLQHIADSELSARRADYR